MLLYRAIVRPISKALVPKRHRPAVRQACYWLRSLLYLGDKVACPCCGGQFRKFLPYGVKSRPNAQCPRCGSKPRHRLVWLYLKGNTNLFSDSLRVLHFAPEYVFRHQLASCPNLFYVTTDLDSLMAMVGTDITRIPFADATFDVVLCNHVLEHVLDDEQAMSELFRVLRPGGWAVLQVPVDLHRAQTFEDAAIVSPQDRERWFLQKDHVRIYGRDYADRLASAGFQVRVEFYAKHLSVDMRDRYGLKRKCPVYLCTKMSTSTTGA